MSKKRKIFVIDVAEKEALWEGSNVKLYVAAVRSVLGPE
jgi:hypothetical protein